MTKNKDPNRKGYIYQLKDPRTNEIRYVGWAFSIKKRLRDHIYESCHPENSLSPNTYKNNWLRKIISEGVFPIIESIEETIYEHFCERERYWVAYYKSIGINLTNGTEGGNTVNVTKTGNYYQWSSIRLRLKLWYALKKEMLDNFENFIILRYDLKINKNNYEKIVEIDELFGKHEFVSMGEVIKRIQNLKNPFKNLDKDKLIEFYNFYEMGELLIYYYYKIKNCKELEEFLSLSI